MLEKISNQTIVQIMALIQSCLVIEKYKRHCALKVCDVYETPNK